MTDAWEPRLPPKPTEPRGRFPAVLTVFTVLALAVLLGLGGWQLQRLQWKRAILARVAAAQAAPPRPLAEALDRLARTGDADFVRVTVECPGVATAPFVELYTVREGQAGSRLISACAIQDARYRTLLVDRGMVADTVSARPPVDTARATPVVVTGVLRRPETRTFVTPPPDLAANRWFSRDIPQMARALGAAAPAPVMLMAETSTNPEWRALTPAPLPTDIPNRHLEYALTWFGLAAALAGVYAAMLFRERDRRRSNGPGS